MRSARIPYSDEELAWLDTNRVMVIGDYAAAFNAKFKRTVTPAQLHSLRKRKGWKIGRALCNAKAKSQSRVYTPEQLEWLKANCTLTKAEYARAFNARFARSADPENLHSLRTRKGWRTGRTGRFEKGQEPANKGKPCPPGKGGRHPNAQKTHFKPGVRCGVAVKLYKPIGAERLSKEGFLERKIHDGLPLQSRWCGVHLLRWEEANGAIPAGHCLKCIDGDRLNTDPANWTLISRGALAVLNQKWNGLDFNDAPTELKPAILAIAKLKHATSARGHTTTPPGKAGRAHG